jgi:phage terminase large subunit GpA-like protein
MSSSPTITVLKTAAVGKSTVFDIDLRVIATFKEAAGVFKPPPKLKVSEWAEQHRILSTESSREAGRYRTSVAPFQKDMQDAVNIPGVEKITLMTAAQLCKSTVLENVFAYFCSEDPCPMIYGWPTKEIAKDWSLDTLDPMIRDTPKLSALFEQGEKSKNNKTLFKKFPGGSLAIIGMKSAGQLRRRRAKVIFFEEIDDYDVTAGDEGDPRMLLAKRQETFWDAITLEASTCTNEGDSAIAASYEASNQQKYWVPCPHCSSFQGSVASDCALASSVGETAAAGSSPRASEYVSPAVKAENQALKLDGYQVLHWERKDGVLGGMVLDKTPPHSGTAYECAHCGVLIEERHKPWMLKHGEWRAKYPERVKHQGFHISTIYSPFPRASWANMTAQFLYAVAHRENPQLLKVFVTLSLAETWKESEIEIDEDELMRRAESWTSLPDKVTVLTAGVDVQEDRLEISVKGWGKGQESWLVDWVRIDGNTALKSTWEKLDRFLTDSRYLHARGVRLPIACAFIDAGFRAGEVYAFTAPRWGRRICACRGMSGFNKAPVEQWNRKNKQKQKVFPIHVDVLKELVYSRMKIESGPGAMWYNREKVNLEYFKQLKSEKLKKKYDKGFPKRFWWKPDGVRNEALDVEVYALAGLLSLSKDIPGMLESLREQLIAEARELAARKKEKLDPNQLALIQNSPIDKEQLARDGVIAIADEAAIVPAVGEYRVEEDEAEEEEEEDAPAPASRRKNFATDF